jgi:hypothetical protein
MATERVFNLFVYFDAGVADEYGVRHHRAEGGDAEKTALLLSRVEEDHPRARRFRFARNFTPEEWLAAMRHGDVLRYFEEALAHFRAPIAPIYCITAIVDGVPRVDRKIGPEPFRGDTVSEIEDHGSVPDYLVHYTDGKEFRFTELIHDDYFKAIRTLFNAKLHVSCAKLLMSCIDTLAFIEYGDVSNNFTRWLDSYADLSSHGIDSNELWEFRNSVLHMTNLASRKVSLGKVSPIMPYVGGPDRLPVIAPKIPKAFNLYGLILTIGEGIGKWGETYNTDRDKILKFIERYDTTIFDSRMASFSYASSTK